MTRQGPQTRDRIQIQNNFRGVRFHGRVVHYIIQIHTHSVESPGLPGLTAQQMGKVRHTALTRAPSPRAVCAGAPPAQAPLPGAHALGPTVGRTAWASVLWGVGARAHWGAARSQARSLFPMASKATPVAAQLLGLAEAGLGPSLGPEWTSCTGRLLAA